ncbi:TIM barrel protein [Pelosinus propionicus]|uniref:Hydroxypyruvate isomerase n=1 Tax=Pelosinus propionicus DSM 13327 TaxID=1123291 RepID=A0A1I4L5A9_9FIRM|nr:TIM barrel protein [Pelosinus propionicus]SFL86218.1 hydroxypyruvate isomerase [Pelosinus propionicus DSM 13327]
MKKSACIEMMFTEVPFEERFTLAKEAGFQHIEFWSWKDKDITKIKSLCESCKLNVASFSGDQDFSMIYQEENDAYIAFVIESIKTAIFLDCKYLVLHSNALGEGGRVVNAFDEINADKKFANMVYVLKKIVPIAEKYEITLVVEALNTQVDHLNNFLAYTKDAVALIDIVNSKYVKILYDVYHMQVNEGNIIDSITRYIKSIGYIHIADVPGRHEPGTGEINYKNVMECLRRLAYDGMIGFELIPSKESKNVARYLLEL